jgi:hypothetical protein
MATDIVFMLENSAPETRFELIVRDSFHQKRTRICELFCENSKNKEKKRAHTRARVVRRTRSLSGCLGPAAVGRQCRHTHAWPVARPLSRRRDETTNKLEMLLAI